MITFLFIFFLECVPEWRKAKDIIPQAPGKPPQEPKLAKYGASDSDPFYGRAQDMKDAQGNEHSSSNGQFVPKGAAGARNPPKNNPQKNNLNRSRRNANLSPGGANHLSVRGFCDAKRRKIHIEKHKNKEPEFSGMTDDEYEKAAVDLLESSTGNGIEGYMDALGNIVRYDRRKNWLAIGNDSGVWTMYAPKKWHSYFTWLMRRDMKNGGRK